MKKIERILLLFTWVLIPLWTVRAQQVKLPEGKKAAIILTYDDGLHSQLDYVIPQLEKKGFKGTFFLYAAALQQSDLPLWKEVARKGHELGNHSLYHPCNSVISVDSINGFCRSLECYTVKDMIEEIRLMNLLLYALDGKEQHAYAYPCSQTQAGDGDFSKPMIAQGVINYARTDDEGGIITDLSHFNPGLVSSFAAHTGFTYKEIIPYVKNVVKAHGVGVLIFHGVGGDYLTVSAEEHQKLIDYLAKHTEIWIGTFSEVLDYITLK